MKMDDNWGYPYFRKPPRYHPANLGLGCCSSNLPFLWPETEVLLEITGAPVNYSVVSIYWLCPVGHPLFAMKIAGSPPQKKCFLISNLDLTYKWEMCQTKLCRCSFTSFLNLLQLSKILAISKMESDCGGPPTRLVTVDEEQTDIIAKLHQCQNLIFFVLIMFSWYHLHLFAFMSWIHLLLCISIINLFSCILVPVSCNLSAVGLWW
jgi:hypothetical protein